jgi:methyltransferase, FkbM family
MGDKREVEKGLCSVRCGDLRLFLREHVTEDYWVTEGLFFADEYYPLKISRDDVVLDVGANIGIFTCRTSKRANEVISIEPDPSNFEVLKRNVEVNQLKNAMLLNFALLDRDETVYSNRTGGFSESGKIWNTHRS